MKTKIFTVYDSKAEHYMKTLLFNQTGEAIRAFTDLVNDRGTCFNLHPEDYTLFELGEYDNLTAEIKMLPVKQSLKLGLEVKQPQASNEFTTEKLKSMLAEIEKENN